MSTKNCECKFCNISRGVYPLPELDTPIINDEHYYCIASIGAFIEGWSLLVPKRHSYSMRECYADSGFLEAANKLLTLLYTLYDRVLCFEHGAASHGSLTACGTAHAHLHFIPGVSSLLESLAQSGLHWERCEPLSIPTIVPNSGEYLFYREFKSNQLWDNSEGIIHKLDVPRSQFFRKILAKQSGFCGESDYKSHPHLATSIYTRQLLTDSLFSRAGNG